MRAGRGAIRPYRPPTEWVGLAQEAETVVALNTKVLVGSFFTDDPTTIRRTRGIVSWRSDQVIAAENPMGAFGLCVVSDNAFAAGAASIPGPFTDADSELWFVHQYLYATVDQGSGGFTRSVEERYVIDSSAMRKFTQEERIVVMFENASGAHGALSLFMIRALFSDTRG